MFERSEIISWIRGELVGPSRYLKTPEIVSFQDRLFLDNSQFRRGPLAWKPNSEAEIEEILYYDRETPKRKYGAGLLYPGGDSQISNKSEAEVANQADDTLGIDGDEDDLLDDITADTTETVDAADISDYNDEDDEFDLTSVDVRNPSTIGITFCANIRQNGELIVSLPQKKRFTWQNEETSEFPLNGRYESCSRRWIDEQGNKKDTPIWRRHSAVLPDTKIIVSADEFYAGKTIKKNIDMPEGSPINLRLEIFPRAIPGKLNIWLISVVLRNSTLINTNRNEGESILYQTYFDVRVKNGQLEKYPESQRPFSQLDSDEQSLALLYRESATWGIGHGCAAGWDSEPDQFPDSVYTDILPSVEIPSMTPDITDENGSSIVLSMRSLVTLPDENKGSAWQSIDDLVAGYSDWIQRKRIAAKELPADLQLVADRHIDGCLNCLNRIKSGVNALRNDHQIRAAFKLTNLSMLLQQIATKQLKKRPLKWDKNTELVSPVGAYQSPWDIFEKQTENEDIGIWRPFQIAFLLMSIEGVCNSELPDHEIVDLIWFPTGGGKTEAYLAVMAFYMFYQRLISQDDDGELRHDGTNVLMRYTLRMLTTQQFQRAASLICAMEYLRRNPSKDNICKIPGKRFSLGLWIGSEGSPNNINQAKTEVSEFRSGRIQGNPLVLTECPWCRAEIGRDEEKTPKELKAQVWNNKRVKGIAEVQNEGPLLLCPDYNCEFGAEHWENWLPVEVIDDRIYKTQPSLIISTADKFAIIAYRPEAGALFGRNNVNNETKQTHVPPGLIVQDELHLISGPLGTMYALYEGIFERLCSYKEKGGWIKPKLIASTATIRGASDQILALYARTQMQLFPNPGLTMGDSYFGTYAKDENNKLRPGRLYLGIHGNNYGSVLTTQVRTFSTALFRSFGFTPESRDAWWSLLTFYNSIRELGGARTLFDSDIRSRLKFLFNREDYPPHERRNLKIVEELTSRLTHAEIVAMLDRLSKQYSSDANDIIDVCLASNIIEVGVDIPRLSLMGVVGQPKTTAQYIQVTGRVGRQWWKSPGLILTIYNPSKSRDRSHFEQFHSYHRRLYERVEPTSATPFALSAINRAMPGALILWARQHSVAPVNDFTAYENELNIANNLLEVRCQLIKSTTGSASADVTRSLQELTKVLNDLKTKWGMNPQKWEEFPPDINGEYLMLWPGQYASDVQKKRGTVVASSMRQVDGSAELNISQNYTIENALD